MVKVYGFGSYFAGDLQYSDKDLLLVHHDMTDESCAMAIACKKTLLRLDNKFDITMLSVAECINNEFIRKSSARHIGNISDVSNSLEYNAILQRVKGAYSCAQKQKFAAIP